MQELCLLCGALKTRTTPCHPVSDGLVERFNRILPPGQCPSLVLTTEAHEEMIRASCESAA